MTREQREQERRRKEPPPITPGFRLTHEGKRLTIDELAALCHLPIDHGKIG